MAGGVVAVVKDLFFVARIRETARLVGTPLTFARSSTELETELRFHEPDLVLVDLTAPREDLGAVFATIEAQASRVRVLGFTSHALARDTQPWHRRCTRVVTRETLTQELPAILRNGPEAPPSIDQGGADSRA